MSMRPSRSFWLATALSLALLAAPTAFAATSFTVADNVGGSIGLGNTDLKQTTIRVLNWVLGILALVALTMIMGSVVIAATSSEKAEAAKKTIAGAVIGLIIVLLAWAIVLFVTRTTANVTS